jgi:mono/diheme cytochrome c family protein
MRIRSVVRWGVRIVAGTLALVLTAAVGVYGYSNVRMARHFTVPAHPIALRADSATLATGKRLATVRGCIDCHGATLGGTVMFDDAVIGRLAAPNLTLGGRGGALDTLDWERAIRHGVRRDGSALRIMPAQEFTTIADDEIAAIVSYIRSVPPVTSTQPSPRVGPLIRVLYLAGQVKLLAAEEIDHTKAHTSHVEPEPTAKYGEYLASGCTGCHGPTLSGGKIPGGPPDWKPAANITPAGIGRYSEADFMRVLREGKRPDGSPVDSLMPWRLTKSMTDVELKAVYAYLRTVPPKEYGNR